MKIVIDGIERHLEPEIADKLKAIGEVSYESVADLIINMVESQVKVFEFDNFCEHCGCKLGKYLGDLEFHKGDCPNIPF